MKGGLPIPIHSVLHQPVSILPAHFGCSFSMAYLWIYSFSADLTLSRNKKRFWENQKRQNRLYGILYEILSEIGFTQHPPKNPQIDSFIHSFIGKSFSGKNIFLILWILVQSDPATNSSMQQQRKPLPVIYCSTYLEPALLVDGLVCHLIIHFLKKYSLKIKSFEKVHESWMSLSIQCEENKSSNNYLLWNKGNNSFQIMKESLQLICRFLTFNS